MEELLKDITTYNNNMNKSIEIRGVLLNKLNPQDLGYNLKKVSLEASLETLKFEQKHLQTIIDRYTEIDKNK